MKQIGNILLVIFLVSVALLPFCFIGWKNVKSYNEGEKVNEEYPLLNDCEEEIKGVITVKTSSIHIRGALLFTLSNGYKFALGSPAHNYLYEEPDMVRFIKENDSIYKPANSDSVYVYRNGTEYYFVLGKLLNKK